MSDEDETITTGEAAELLGVKSRMVRVYVEGGLLPARKITPRMLLFNRADVERFAASPKRPKHRNRSQKNGKPKKLVKARTKECAK